MQTAEDEAGPGAITGGDAPVSVPSAHGHLKGTRLGVVTALVTLYIVWGSTYLAQRFALDGFPVFFLGGIRFVLAGAMLFAFARWRGSPRPTRREVMGASLIGLLLLGVGNSGVLYAELTVTSGMTALGVATVPLWVALMSGFYGLWPSRREWLGLLVGFSGLVLLNLDHGLRASPVGAIAILVSSLGWSFGSVLSRRVSMPPGIMASAVQMFVGGLVLFLEALITGERFTSPPQTHVLLAMLYLIGGAILGFTAYNYLLRHTRAAVATSYSYVNPVIAMLLGAALAAEPITRGAIGALVLIVAGVALAVSEKGGG